MRGARHVFANRPVVHVNQNNSQHEIRTWNSQGVSVEYFSQAEPNSIYVDEKSESTCFPDGFYAEYVFLTCTFVIAPLDPVRFHRPARIRMVDDGMSPPASEKTMYQNTFEQKDHPSQFPDAGSKQNPVVTEAHDLVEPSGNPHALRGWGLHAPYQHYEPTREPVHPRKPDLSQGQLAAGATVVRTDVWKKEGEPAIMSIARFSPDNFRPVGYAENAPAPTSTVSEGHLDFRHNRLPPHHADRKPFYYFVNAVTGFVAAGLIRGAVVKVVHMLWPARDVVAAGVVDVDLTPIKPGQNFIARWRGKPIFIRRRTQEMIDLALKDDLLLGSMRDPEKDAGRVQKQEWLVTVGICTHLGCIPYPDQGLYGGYFCPCHGSHYDHSGRIRLGPATSNLKVPEYRFLDDNTIRLGS